MCERITTQREVRLVALLTQAQSRLRNQGGDISEITEQLNLQVHDDIERELGGKLFLASRSTV